MLDEVILVVEGIDGKGYLYTTLYQGEVLAYRVRNPEKASQVALQGMGIFGRLPYRRQGEPHLIGHLNVQRTDV